LLYFFSEKKNGGNTNAIFILRSITSGFLVIFISSSIVGVQSPSDADKIFVVITIKVSFLGHASRRGNGDA